jgi:dTDP-glucose pyrophosphorylase
LETRKAVVLARGLGTRMQRSADGVQLGRDRADLAARGLKALMPLNGRPFLDYIADSLLRAGLRQICFVVAPDADLMRQGARRIQEATGAAVACAVQDEPRGTADAVLAAEGFAGGEPFVMCNGDNLYPHEALAGLARLEDEACWLVAFDRDGLVAGGNIGRERVRDFAVVTSSPSGELTGIVEKPPDPERYAVAGRLWISMNLYRFTEAVFDACRRVAPDPRRGELELTAAVGDLVRQGAAGFRVLPCTGGVFDLTTRADVPAAEKALAGRRLCF